MPQTHKNLGQSRPAAATNTTLYTAPAVTTTIVSSILVANIGADADLMRIFAVPSGGVTGVGNAIYYDVELQNRDTALITAALTLDTGDFVVVYSRDGDLTFTVSGLEIT